MFTFAAVAAAGALAVWLVLARRKSVRLDDAAIIADRRADAGGLLLTRLEVPIGEWELGLNQRVRAVTVPPIDARRPISWVMLALLAGAIAFWVPLPVKQVRPTSSAAATRVDALQDKMEALAREEPDDSAAEKELERLREELDDGTFDAADWEAADTLDQALDKQAAQAQTELSKADAAAKALEDAMAAAQNGEGSAREREELEKALMELADGQAQTADEAMKQAMGEGKNPEQKPQDGKGTEQQQGQQGQQAQSGQDSKSGREERPVEVAAVEPSSGAAAAPATALTAIQPERRGPAGSRPAATAGLEWKLRPDGRGRQERAGQIVAARAAIGFPEPSESQRQRRHERRACARVGAAEGAAVRAGSFDGSRPARLRATARGPGRRRRTAARAALRESQPGKHGTASAGTSQTATGVQARGNDDGALLPRNRELIKRYFEK